MKKSTTPLSFRAGLLRRITRLLLRPIFGGTMMPPEKQRRRLNVIARMTQSLAPRGTVVLQNTLGGVPTEWVENIHSSVRGYMLFLHGGGYVVCSPQSHRNLTAHIAKAAALRVAAIDYRLAPEHAFPTAVDDALAAYRGLLDMGIEAQSIIMLATPLAAA